jgi:bla regulator protein BlaR1
MPVLFVFLLKVNIALLLFCAGYYLVLRHLTFYTLNRIYLITAILFASIYPQINLSGFAERHQQIANPVQAVVLQLQAPAETWVKPLTQPNYWYWAEVVFWVGAALLAIRLLVQLFSLYMLYRNSTATKLYDHNIRVINSDAAPFSFWKSIYVNPANHEPADLKSILLHEQVHINEWHTLDILLAELSTIFYWFNPGVWLMKKAVRENIEFITDSKILKNGVDSKAYQYSLVSVSFASTSHTIVNHFNISTIKKRIIMMNAKRSSKFNLTRYAFLVPAVVICLFAISISKAELIKKSKIAYKHIVASVTDIKNVINVTNLVGEKKTIRHTKVIDTIKKSKSITITTASASTDTGKTLNIAVVAKPGPLDSVTIIVGSVVNSYSKVNPNNILSINVIKNEKFPKGLVVIQPKSPTYTVTDTTVDPTLSGTEPVHFLIIADGKEITQKDMDAIMIARSAESVKFYLPGDKAMTVKYGDKGKNGVMIITTKKAN